MTNRINHFYPAHPHLLNHFSLLNQHDIDKKLNPQHPA
jgi:hypothetical protein